MKWKEKNLIYNFVGWFYINLVLFNVIREEGI